MSAHNEALVVGAGPVGLTAALALSSLGVRTTVLEAEPEGRERTGSRALFVHRDTLRLLERMSPGLGAAIADDGVTWQSRRTLYRGREVFARELPTPPAGELPPFTSLRQVETERHVYGACKEAGVRFEWGTEVTALEPAADSVSLTASDGREWNTPYVVAADGPRSAARRQLGIELEGERSEGYHVVVDVEAHQHSPSVLHREFHYEHPGLDGRNVMIVPFAGGFQVDLQCRESDPVEDFADPSAAHRWLANVIDARHLDHIRWVSRYHFLQKVAGSFTDPHRRTLLAGEAAHLFAPFGARGMNSGMADADTAARAVALALAATHPSRAQHVIESWAQERRVAAEFNRAAAAAALAHMRPPRRRDRVRRRTAAALAPLVPSCRTWLEHAPYGPRGKALPTSRY